MAISATLCKYAIKAAGAAGLGIVAYDAHKRGKLYGEIQKNKQNFKALDYYYENSRNLPDGSNFNMKMKDKLFRWELKNNFRGFVNKGVGYVKGFCDRLMRDIVPIGLSVAALAIKATKKIPAPTAADPAAMKTVLTGKSKIAAAALGAYALYGFAKNIFGFGVSKNTK